MTPDRSTGSGTGGGSDSTDGTDSTDLSGGRSGGTDFAGRRVLVIGMGTAGASAARALVGRNAEVFVTDDSEAVDPDRVGPGARYVGRQTSLPPELDYVVVSPGVRPDHRLVVAAAADNVPVLGELELAWQLRRPSFGRDPAPWLVITGTNGKTTTVRMLESIVKAAGLRTLAVGNVGEPIIDAVTAATPYDVLAVEASSFQLHYSDSLVPHAGALLNLAPDHLDWHGSMAAYTQAKAVVFAAKHRVVNRDEAEVLEAFSRYAPPGGRPIRFTLGHPRPGELGVIDGFLVNEAGEAILPASEVRPAGPHNVANALAAAALAGTVNIGADRIALGLRQFVPDPHRNQLIATVGGVSYVDDSKATNPHAAAAALSSYRRVIWIAGGQLKGAPVDELVGRFADRMRGAVLLGQDRAVIRQALTRHAPDLPVIEVSRTDHGAMQDVVVAAASLAAAGDVVLLAPAAASLDMFTSYGARGAAFADAVALLSGSRTKDESA